MNYSDSLKYIWWGIGACGSGTMSQTLQLDFDLKCNNSRNTRGIPEGKEDYTLIVNVRNPYTWELSSYLDLVNGPEEKWQDGMFEQYLYEGGNETIINQVDLWEERMPDYFIRCEDMYSEILKIPNLANHKPPRSWNNIKDRLSNPAYRGKNSKARKPISEDILSAYWTKDLVKKYSGRYEELFKITGYNTDSWKTGIHWDGWEPLK